MISDERLAQLADVKMICVCKDDEYQEMARELLVLRKAFSGTPDVYVVTGGEFFKDRICRMKGEAQEALNTRKDSSYIIGLYRKPSLPE